jgi:hypothetical protein
MRAGSLRSTSRCLQNLVTTRLRLQTAGASSRPSPVWRKACTWGSWGRSMNRDLGDLPNQAPFQSHLENRQSVLTQYRRDARWLRAPSFGQPAQFQTQPGMKPAGNPKPQSLTPFRFCTCCPSQARIEPTAFCQESRPDVLESLRFLGYSGSN